MSGMKLLSDFSLKY